MATYRRIRYADDFVILVRGTREQAESVRDEAARVLRDELEMELSEEKTLVTHVDDGFDFLGHRIRRVAWRKSKVAFTYPSKRIVKSKAVKYKVKNLTTRSTTHLSLKTLLLHVNSVLRGWATYFRYDASKRTLAYVDSFAWRRVFRWLRKKHPTRNLRYLHRRYCGGRWWIHDDDVELFRPSKVRVERYRYRGTRILLPWMEPAEFGAVGRYARTDYDDVDIVGALDETLEVA